MTNLPARLPPGAVLQLRATDLANAWTIEEAAVDRRTTTVDGLVAS